MYLLRALEQMRKDDPEAKAVVFSTRASVLQLVDQAVRDNGMATASLGLAGGRDQRAVNLNRAHTIP